MTKPNLLFVDDDPLLLESMRFAFNSETANLETATSAAAGLEIFKARRPDVVVLDIGLPDISGLQAVRQFREIDLKVPVIVVTGLGTAATAIEAMRQGAYEYVEKPFDLHRLYEIVERAVESSRLMRVPAILPEEDVALSESAGADVLVGRCQAMQDVYRAIGRAARQNVTVLITGESGTGKEVVARALYHYSDRSEKPFLAINCAAIPETLLESELFGHEKGAFTGADRRRIGKFEQCDGGTLFLDEIGDMSLLTQSKVLRVLQDQQFERVGGIETIRTDVRLIAATNRDLPKLMEGGQFRGDLYYRLNVYSIRLPPLRDRAEDLPLLVHHILARASRELGREPPTLAAESLEILQRYSWPGNIRELQSVIKHALIESTGPLLLPEALPPYVQAMEAGRGGPTLPPAAIDRALERYIEERIAAGSQSLLADVMRNVERQLFVHVWRHTGGNVTQAARLLGITRVTARSKAAAYGVTPARESASPGD